MVVATFMALVFGVALIQAQQRISLDAGHLDDDEDAWVDGDTVLRSAEQVYTAQQAPAGIRGTITDVIVKTNPVLVREADQRENLRPGAMGAPYKIENPTPVEQTLIEAGYKRHAFNEYISDQISLHRSLPDHRNSWCKMPGLHLESLLPASVVMCFHNEALSVLLRSVHSILDRTPEHLLTEIVLVDDSSELDNLKEPLDAHLRNLPKVKLLRSRKRLGLIRARMLGSNNAAGPILVFLDSHVEVTLGWLEPLSDRITKDGRNVVCPVIDVIDDDTFEFKLSERSVTAVGGFNWDMIFTWKTASDEVLRSLKTPADPVPSPTMAGGLFAIHKQFFDRLGQYDEEYEIWGAENLEISFKTWMCGGRLEIIPCSHIGHVYRKRSPYSRNGTESRPYRNYVRLAAVWLDEYAKYYYQKIGHNLGDYGDISSRLELKQRLGCQNFEWFVQNVYPDIFNPKRVAAEGEIRNEAFGGNLCLDAISRLSIDPTTKKSLSSPIMWPCHKQGGNQHWYWTPTGELRRDETCLDYAGEGEGNGLKMYPCHGQKGNQFWIYDTHNGFIIQVISQLCLTLDSRDKLSVSPCQGRITQRWKVSRLNLKRVQRLGNLAEDWREKWVLNKLITTDYRHVV